MRKLEGEKEQTHSESFEKIPCSRDLVSSTTILHGLAENRLLQNCFRADFQQKYKMIARQKRPSGARCDPRLKVTI
jgi:hypothetical protein